MDRCGEMISFAEKFLGKAANNFHVTFANKLMADSYSYLVAADRDTDKRINQIEKCLTSASTASVALPVWHPIRLSVALSYAVNNLNQLTVFMTLLTFRNFTMIYGSQSQVLIELHWLDTTAENPSQPTNIKQKQVLS